MAKVYPPCRSWLSLHRRRSWSRRRPCRCRRKTPAVNVPAPKEKAPETCRKLRRSIVLAGGCFWGVQGVFQHVDGVQRAISGYAGGTTEEPDLSRSGQHGHDRPRRIGGSDLRSAQGFARPDILQIYFSVAHDPTEVNRQGPDDGTQYRSEIFAARSRRGEIRQGLHLPNSTPRKSFRVSDRDQSRALGDVLSG